MSSTGDNLVLEHLRHIRMVVDDTRSDVKELRTRVGFVEEGQARLEAQYAHISVRMDRLETRMERLERRVGLADA
jgi:predicted nuclease with TOPRIM domain